MNEPVTNSDWYSFLPTEGPLTAQSKILWVQVVADGLLSLSYFLIPLLILYFFWFRRKDIKFSFIYLWFIALMLCYGGLHLMNVLIHWQPLYLAQTIVKGVASAASVVTAILLWPILTHAFRAPSSKLIDEKNRELELISDKYKLLLERTGVGVFEWYDLNNPRAPLVWSSHLFELLGFKPNSFEPTLDFYVSLIHPEDRELFHQTVRQIGDGQTAAAPVEYRLRVLNEYRWFQARQMHKFDAHQKPHFLIGTVEDIHDQKMNEEKIRGMNQTLEEEIKKRTKQLEMANRAKTRFLANMSHEMRTPLGLVLGFSELLEEKNKLDPESREYVRMITKNGEILSRIINDLLDLSKIEAGKLRFQYTRVKLKNLIKDFENAFAEQAAEKKIRMSFQNLCSEDEVVVTDEIRLKQVIYNLLSNALKFTSSGSVHLTLGKKDKTYYIDVVDTGTGIPDADKETIFDEYARGEMADAGKTSGTGLGLRLAQNLAHALGGQVELVSSQIGKGSHFRMTFQSDEEKLQRQIERKHSATVNSKLNSFEIFVLDDNEDNIRLAEIFLRKLGTRVRGFTSAKSMFAELVSNTPDLILLDIHMPEMNGFEVFTYLRKSGYKNPIWALTAYSLNEDIQTILEYGFDDYIRKPVSIESMKRKLTFELRERMND